MTDREISAGCAIAYGAWITTAVLLIVMWGTSDIRAGVTGLVIAGVAVTATVRTYFVGFAEMVRRAFDLEHESPTPLRR